MAVKDLFKGTQYKKELDQLKQFVSPEVENLIDLDNMKIELEKSITSIEKEKGKAIKRLDKEITQKTNKSKSLLLKITQQNNEIASKQKQIFTMNETILMQEFGLYEPMYEFANSEEFKDRLKQIRLTQKELIKSKRAFSTNPKWTVDGSVAKGRKMSNDIGKLLIRNFNSECDALVAKVKFNNIDLYKTRISKSFEQVNKLGVVVGVSLGRQYYDLKIQELHLSHEFAEKKQQEKEEARAERERLREEEKLRQEIQRETEKINKEEKHFSQALDNFNSQIKSASDKEKEDLLKRIAEIEEELNKIKKKKSDMDYRVNNTRAGYVYIISNIGAFGESVYKIGMTRRLEPLDRVRELGDASVPFRYDVHAMIFSDDAPTLENALHKAFRNNAVNLVNNRREFFRTELVKIADVVKNNHDKTIEFEEIPQAEEYRTSEKMRKS